MKGLLLLALAFIGISCTSKVNKAVPAEGRFKEIRNKLLTCILESSGISENLRKYSEESKASTEKRPLRFRSIELGENDREIIKNCKRQVLGKIRKERKERKKNKETKA